MDTVMHNVKVWIKEGEHLDIDTWTGKTYKCPNCQYTGIKGCVNYCSYCGVRLGWDLSEPNKTLKNKNEN